MLKIKEEGVLAGMAVAEKIFRFMQPGAGFEAFKRWRPHAVWRRLFTVRASVHTILQCERLVLNCMQRMSSIATLTHRYTEKTQTLQNQTARYPQNDA